MIHILQTRTFVNKPSTMASEVDGLHINYLAEELILKILSYLAIDDLISVSQTSDLFNRLACDKELVRELNFSRAYTCTTESLKTFLVPRRRCLHINTLNLSNCYWIKSANLIVKLKNLQSLHMDAIPLSFPQLEAILKACSKIENLFICWPEEYVPKSLKKWKETVDQIDEDVNVIRNLLSLRVQVNLNYAHLMVFLTRCSALQRLIITGHYSRKTFSPSTHMAYPDKWDIRLPYLRDLVVDLDDACTMFPIPYLMGIFLGAKREKESNPADWNMCWINNRIHSPKGELISDGILSTCSKLYLKLTFDWLKYIENLGELKNLKELMVVGADAMNFNITSLLGCCPNLQSLNVLFGLNISIHISKVFEKLPHLKRLSLHCQPLQGPPKIAFGVAQFQDLTHLTVPVCALIEIRDKEKRKIFEEDVDYTNCTSFKRRRIGCRESATIELAAFNEVFENCPRIELLQIGFNQEISCSPLKVQWECLSNVRKLKNLTKLTLDSIPITSGKFLVEIANGCTQLEFLRLRRLGPSGKCVYIAQLVDALPFYKNLVHLSYPTTWYKIEDWKLPRIEQNYLAPGTGIFRALEDCPKLERVALLAERDMMPFDPSALEHFIENQSNLIFVFVLGGAMTRDLCTKLTRKFKKVKSRPALVVRIKNILTDVFDDRNQENLLTPACHYNEMITFRSWMYDFYDVD